MSTPSAVTGSPRRISRRSSPTTFPTSTPPLAPPPPPPPPPLARCPGLGAPGLRPACYGGEGPDGLAARCAANDGAFPPVLTAADDVAMLASTSGTTGQPKVAMHFHRDILATCDTFSHYLIKPHRDDVFTGTPPLGFTYGLGGLLLYPLRACASTLLLERATPAQLADAIAAHGATVPSTPPTAHQAMLARGKP